MLNIFLAIPTVNIPEHLSPTILIAFLEPSFAPLAKIIFFPFIFSIPNSELVQSTSLFSSIFKRLLDSSCCSFKVSIFFKLKL